MFVIGVAGLKGGIGKSTIALNLASALHREGRRVLLVDVDPQKTCEAWAERAAGADQDGPPVVGIQGSTLRRDLRRVGAPYEILVLDSPARLGTETLAVMVASDVVLLPVTPGGADVWALEKTIEKVREAQTLRELRAAIVLNRVDRTVLRRHVEQELGQLDVPILDARLGQRVTFGEATIAGAGVVDYAGSSEAAVEVRRLARETLRLGAAA